MKIDVNDDEFIEVTKTTIINALNEIISNKKEFKEIVKSAIKESFVEGFLDKKIGAGTWEIKKYLKDVLDEWLRKVFDLKLEKVSHESTRDEFG